MIFIKERVRILYACESGSRAWGFASSDSDYDVCFIYVRDEKDYLCLNEKRDVIEWELNEKFDITGWDLKKALKLAKSSNPSFFEWLKSPIIYKTSSDWVDFINDFSFSHYFNTKKAVFHYLSIANKHIKRYFAENKTLVNQKKYFYIIRSILCAKFIIYASQNNAQSKIPPIQIEKLLPFVENEKVLSIIKNLIEKKNKMPEKLLGKRILELDKWIFETLDFVTSEVQKLNDYFCNDWTRLNNIFFNFVKNFSNGNKK